MGSSPTRGSSFFLGQSDCLGCAVLLCLVVCLTLLASFFFPYYIIIHGNEATYNSCVYWWCSGIRVVSNAGGVNLHACVAALHEAASEQGVELNVAVVTGDEFMDKVHNAYM